MEFFVVWIESVAVLGLVGGAAAAVLLGLLATPAGRVRLRRIYRDGGRGAVLGAALVAAAGMGGSLYLSEGVGFAPCVLCWYQRIAMYPLVAVAGAAWLGRVRGAWRVALPLPVVGLVISLYHAAIQLRPSLDLGTCSSGIPCSARYVAVFGFVSIPVLAGLAFLMIIALLVLAGVLERDATAAAGQRDVDTAGPSRRSGSAA